LVLSDIAQDRRRIQPRRSRDQVAVREILERPAL